MRFHFHLNFGNVQTVISRWLERRLRQNQSIEGIVNDRGKHSSP